MSEQDLFGTGASHFPFYAAQVFVPINIYGQVKKK